MPDIVVIGIIGIIIYFVYDFMTKDTKQRNKFRREWQTGSFLAATEDMRSISSYWSNKKKNAPSYYGVDQLTWDDLAMQEVFNKINYTQSTVGSEYLFNKLRDIDPSLENEEQLYLLLANNKELREDVLLILSSLGKRNYTNSSSYFNKQGEEKLKHANVYVLLAMLPIASFLLLFFDLKYGIFSLVLSFILNLIVYYRNKSKLENKLYSITYVAAIVNAGKRLASIKNSEFNSFSFIVKDNVRSLQKIARFGKLISSESRNGNLEMFLEYIRMLFMLDFIFYNKIVQALSDSEMEYREVWQFIGRLDAAIAVVFYRKSLETYCTPSFVEKEELSFENIVHPLLKNPVTNSSDIGKCTLITGSNASGKSTYIKAIAINSILAQTINTALAETWTMKPSYIVTSMAIQDNVLQGDSYFIAEIKSLKRIIRLIEEGKPCLSFIDEILKGTNTIERISASAAMMEWLASNKGMNILASHDIELTEMVRHAYINYHFRETIENGEVLFDYKIHEGPSQTRNAIKLLEILNYPESVTEQANALAIHFTESREWKTIAK